MMLVHETTPDRNRLPAGVVAILRFVGRHAIVENSFKRDRNTAYICSSCCWLFDHMFDAEIPNV